ncbi:MAG: ImmA/IrrE family metallo-endopeptidase [Bacteroidota bacterium]
MDDIKSNVPASSRNYINKLLEKHHFNFILKNNRSTKLGDFRHNRKTGTYTISVNRNLNSYQFLITFLHELAHLIVAKSKLRTAKAHGTEWKTAFHSLVQPLLTDIYFPQPLLSALSQHMKNPKASAGSDPKLWTALRAFDKNPYGKILDDLNDGEQFVFRNKEFIRIEKRRTRVLSKQLNSKRLYLIPAIAEIEVL